MQVVDLEPLAPEGAAELSRRLIRGEGIACDETEVASHLARVTDGIAFYIQHLVWDLGLEGGRATNALVDLCLKKRLTDPLDTWRLRYYEERIDTHYPPAFRPIARAVLDLLATGHALTLNELTERIDPAKTERDTELVRRVLTLLGLDHYITREEQQYRFRSPFILRIWQNVRGLGE